MNDNRSRMAQAIAYIEQNLFEDLSVATVALASGLSPFHFHRTFQAMAGEPVAEYVKKRRLDAAADFLSSTDRRIIDIAVECGFSSQEAFARAFAKAFGWPPGIFRKLRPPRKRYRRIDSLGGDMSAFPPAPPSFETLEERRVFGIGKTVVMEGYSGARTILGLWKDFCDRWSADLTPAQELYGLGLYELDGLIPEGASFEYFACAPLEPDVPLPSGFEERRIPGGLYAVFEYDGPARRTRDAFNYIFGVWFPQTPYRLRTDETGSIGFERYRPENMKGTVNRVMSIYVPVELN
ncbi:MAG: AraC family transcriptional regulator [Treponemataceae bacterium]